MMEVLEHLICVLAKKNQGFSIQIQNSMKYWQFTLSKGETLHMTKIERSLS